MSRGWDLFPFLLQFWWNRYDVFVMRNIKEEKLDWRTQWTQWLLSRGLSLFSFCFFCNKFHVSCRGKYALSLSSVFASAIYMMVFAMGNTPLGNIDYYQRKSSQDVLDSNDWNQVEVMRLINICLMCFFVRQIDVLSNLTISIKTALQNCIHVRSSKNATKTQF